jgi:transglutaminase-like putative cysteine protease
LVLRVLAADPDGKPVKQSRELLAQYLASSPYIQSDNPKIVSKARKITRNCAESEKAKVICEWVYANVKKRVAPGIPSAVDVLRTMEGDCNEHTYLFTALARAVGVPTKVRVGIAYTQGAFYYHAWPEVYVGAWLEMDPTFGQTAVDATHIALLEGELANQLELLNLIGRLKAEVLE